MFIPTSRGGCGCYLLIFGIAGVVFGIQEYRLGVKASAEPQKLTCKQLIDKGPGENLHIVLTDYDLELSAFIVQEKKKKKGTWEKVWIPLSPSKTSAEGGSFHVILETDRVHGDPDLLVLQNGGQLNGMVVNDVTSLGTEEQNLLRSNYPKTDFGKCWIIQHERKPKEFYEVLIFGALGVVLFLLGVVLIVSGSRSSKE